MSAALDSRGANIRKGLCGLCVSLVLGFLAACATAPAPPPAPPTPLIDSGISGRWAAGKAELGGRDFRPSANFMLHVEGNLFSTHNGTRPDSGRLVFHAGDPKGLDVIGEHGPTAGRKLMAIYRVLGDGTALEICYDLSGATRPTEFVSKPDTQLFRITYTRAP
ncbi:MAG: hypothetical protein JNM76_16535 [Betaproteobacteria bacterium]|nr:hypothetical protein [Betaproteobacteria bacterium]